MKNKEIIDSMNKLSAFVAHQREAGTSLLSVTGQFVIKRNLKVLNEHYKTYEETLKEICEKYNIEDMNDVESYSDEAKRELDELLDIDVENVELKTIIESDFKDGATFDDISLLEFIIKEEN